ncbi:MAG: hypothetical protein COY56_00965 [Flavobacteriaceae bacterium CG_4_10_14_0_8_um_filter_34_31]|nr:MAG: hypothetical protein COY56_00965 [Flavobacteriaceae bacterium CG_4_10_14_0_8_um_filter_34_31]
MPTKNYTYQKQIKTNQLFFIKMLPQSSPSILINDVEVKPRQIKILLFEKEESIKNLVYQQLKLFKTFTFKLVSVTSENEFKRQLKKVKPNLIISEYSLENTIGKEALTFCAMIYPEIPFLFIIDSLGKKTELEYLNAGATDFLLKENTNKLPPIIFKALRQSEEKNTLKNLKQKKWEESQRFKTLTEFSNTPVLVYNLKGIIQYVSPAITQVLGYSVQEFLGTNVEDYNHPEDLEQRRSIFKNLKKNRERFAKIEEERLLHKKGHYIWVRAVISDARLKPGIKGFISSFIDITERKIKSEALESTIDLLKEQNKRMLNFSYIVSHNLRSHASNIESITGFLETTDDEMEKKEMLTHLKNVSKSLNNTLYNLNEVVSIQSKTTLKVENIKLVPYIKNILSSMKNLIKTTNAVIQMEIPKNTKVYYNKGYLESILQNILLNSIKYKHPDRTPVISISSLEIQNFFILSITDNGIGIDLNKNGNKLFGMYKTFHGNKDALGIGLFMSKNQVEAMGGKIEVESTFGQSTTFKIFIKR